MMLIPCPWCGERAESEFEYGGEGGIVRPPDSESLDDAAWGDYVFMRKNPKGWHHEQWRHIGIGRWFNLLRDTVNNRILASWKIGEPMPDIEVLLRTENAKDPKGDTA